MDPITALGAASSIVQFIDFAARIVCKGNRIYRSGDGILEEYQDLNLVTSDLFIMKAKFEQLNVDVQLPASTDADVATQNLFSAMITLAEQLLKRLTMAQTHGRFRRWKSLRQAIKAVSSKREVDEMATKLSMFRDQLSMRILLSLRERTNSAHMRQAESEGQISQALKDLLRSSEKASNYISADLSAVSSKITEIHSKTEDLVVSAGAQILECFEKTIKGLTATLRCRKLRSKPARLNLAGSDFPQRQRVAAHAAILKAFTYSRMQYRQETVQEAHAETFRWVLDQKGRQYVRWDNFISWLSTDSDLYWITGKAASGKSTLMKYIVSQATTTNELNKWAQDSAVVKANFFFWGLGADMQKSQAGMLRSLLWQIFSQRDDLLEQTLPELWHQAYEQPAELLAALDVSWYHWSLEELKDVLVAVTSQVNVPVKFAFFIDGLDEYDGEHRDIAEFSKYISSFHSTKICLSSRPLLVFESIFGNSPHLCMQDLTKGDIESYVSQKLRSHQSVALQRSHDSDITEIISDVVTKASGIFLWVVLVVRSLIKGLTNHDSIADLRRRVAELPPELDELYSLILGSIDPPFYREQASRLLQLVFFGGLSNFPLAQLSFADDEDGQLALTATSDTFCTSELGRRTEAALFRVRSRCLGLVEVIPKYPTDHTSQDHPLASVQFIHLTLKEFLSKAEVWVGLLKLTEKSGFNAHLQLLRSETLMLKWITYEHDKQKNSTTMRNYISELSASLLNAFNYARNAEESMGKASVELLNELERTASQFPDLLMSDTSFLKRAVGWGLARYVEEKYGNNLRQIKLDSSLLDYAAGSVSDWHARDSVQPAMVDLLLRKGIDPNAWGSDETTAWSRFLSRFRRDLQSTEFQNDPGRKKASLDVCKLFIAHGASEEKIRRAKQNYIPLISSLDVDVARELENLRGEYRAKMQRKRKRADRRDRLSHTQDNKESSRKALKGFDVASPHSASRHRQLQLLDSYRPSYASSDTTLSSQTVPGQTINVPNAFHKSKKTLQVSSTSRRASERIPRDFWPRPKMASSQSRQWANSAMQESRKRVRLGSPDSE